MKKIKYLLACFSVFILPGCYQSRPSQSEFILNTVCTITLYDRGKPGIYREIFTRLKEIENRMSVFSIDGDLDRINKAAGNHPINVSADVFKVIEKAVYYAEISEGAFDPTIAPVVALWGMGGENPKVPAREEIERVLPLVDWRCIELDRVNKTVFLMNPGMALDLGGIAKGYAADEAADIIRKAGIPRAIIDLGGNILTVGQKKDKSLWKIGLQNPLDDRGAYIGIVQVKEKTVVTSGVYERFFTENGVQYHHLFSPDNGYPVRNDLLSVSIITDLSMHGDALSTASFILGYDKGRALIESLEGVMGVFVFEDKTIRLTRGVDFILSDTSYRIADD